MGGHLQYVTIASQPADQQLADSLMQLELDILPAFRSGLEVAPDHGIGKQHWSSWLSAGTVNRMKGRS